MARFGDGPVYYEEHRTPHRRPDHQLWYLRPQKLATSPACGGTARALTLRNIVDPLPSASRRDGLAGARGDGNLEPTLLAAQLRCVGPAHPGRRLHIRSPRDLPVTDADRRSQISWPVSPATAD